MASLILSRRDLEFVLYQCLQVEQLCQRERYSEHNRATFDAALDSAEKMASELFAPHNKKNDQHEPHFDGERVSINPEVKMALDAFAAAGFVAAGQDAEFDGMQLPYVVEKALSTYFTAANVGTASYPFLSVSNANTILK
ncbi:MAG: acyl-CoA dehydrogenase, partial [Burkholderiales bacterium]|nr:acyl-CoA dehydrogenase [Burkholderiales bacterium]